MGESVYISPDLVPDSSLDIHVISSEHKENISDMQNNDDSCNIKCEKINFVMGNQSTQEKVCNPIDNIFKLTENLLDTNYACLEGIPGMVVKQVDSGGTVDVIDEVKFSSEQGTLSLQDHATDIYRLSTNSNLQYVDVCIDSHLEKLPNIPYTKSMKFTVRYSIIELPPAGSPMQKET